MWAARRRTIILLIILGAVALFGVLPYWYTHREIPTCFDKKMNQDERGVDCGGSCALVCRGGAKDIKILWTKVFPVRAGEYDAVAYVENANFDSAAPVLPYTVKLYDADGVLIVEEEGQTYALPSERFVIFRGGILTGDKVVAKGGIEIPNTFRWYTSPKVETSFSVEEKVLTDANKKPKLTALLKNESPELYRDIDVTAIIYDSGGSPIGVSATHVDKIEKYSTEKLSFTWPLPFNYTAETEQCDVPADIILAVDRSGSMVDVGKLDSAKIAAAQFVDRLSSKDQSGYVSFATEASAPIDQPLTNDIARVKRAIEATEIKQNAGLQFTNIADGLQSAINELATFRHVRESRPVIVLLTDGIPTRPENPSDKSDKSYPSEYAKEVAADAKQQQIILYTIGLGEDVDSPFLEMLASKPEYYYESATGAELSGIYQQIATSICAKSPSIFEVIPRVNNSF